MNDDYLWDRSGTPDPDVERLERILAPFGSVPSRFRAIPSHRGRRWRRTGVSLALAATVVLAFVVERRLGSGSVGPAGAKPSAEAPATAATLGRWFVATIDGAPVVGGTAVSRHGHLDVGAILTTDPQSRARMASEDVGEVVVEPESRVRLVSSGDGRARLALERGALQAFIVSPPGRFVVDTPSATAVDLGCVYTLQVGEKGDGVLSVTAGWVAFEFGGRQSFVPAGASCRTRAAAGPGLPRFDDANQAFARAIDALESAADASARSSALAAALRRARPRDALTLWHMIPLVTPAERPLVVRALQVHVPLPVGVRVESVLSLDRESLDRWWDALGLGDIGVWRQWVRPLPLAR